MKSPRGADTQGMDMQICYIWTERYKSLRNFGLNLSSDYEFNFDGHEITATAKPNIISKLYGNKISNISALVGINGSGKTTALELICRCISNPDELSNDWLAIFKKNNHYYYSSKNNERCFGPEFIRQINSLSDFRSSKTIYYSNVYDGNTLDFPDNILDLSKNKKVEIEKRTPVFSQKNNHEIVQQVNFILSEKPKKLNITTPEWIEFKHPTEVTLLSDRSRTISNRVYVPIDNVGQLEETIKLINKIIITERNENKRRYKEERIPFILRWLFIIELMSDIKPKEELWRVICHIIANHKEKIHSSKDILYALASSGEKMSEINYIYNKEISLQNMATCLLNVERDIFHNSQTDIDNSSHGKKSTFFVKITKENAPLLIQLVTIFDIISRCQVRWVGQSSGEKAYMDLFSLIWAHTQHANGDSENEHTLICIDEPDVYLHPQWQIQFISQLVKTLPSITGNKTQIIFTTHSPLLISDMPRQFISKMDKSKSNSVQESKSPFGANLYDIYGEIFELGYKSMGSIAAKYINKVLKVSAKEKLSASDIRLLREANEIIGDNVIKFHLEARLDNLSITKESNND